jgi:hypothetical protein
VIRASDPLNGSAQKIRAKTFRAEDSNLSRVGMVASWHFDILTKWEPVLRWRRMPGGLGGPCPSQRENPEGRVENGADGNQWTLGDLVCLGI